MLTIDLAGVHLPVDHPVGLVQHLPDRPPGGVDAGIEDGLADDPKADQDDDQDNQEVAHVPQLEFGQICIQLKTTSSSIHTKQVCLAFVKDNMEYLQHDYILT